MGGELKRGPMTREQERAYYSDERSRFMARWNNERDVVLAESARECPFCGRVLEPLVLGDDGQPWTSGNVWVRPRSSCGCQGERDAIAAQVEQDAKTRQEHRRAAWAWALQKAGLVGLLATATLDFNNSIVNSSLSIDIPPGAALTEASMVVEGVGVNGSASSALDFYNGVLGSNVYAYSNQGLKLYPPTVDPRNHRWTLIGNNEVTLIAKLDDSAWETRSGGQGLPPYEYPLQLYRFIPVSSGATAINVTWQAISQRILVMVPLELKYTVLEIGIELGGRDESISVRAGIQVALTLQSLQQRQGKGRMILRSRRPIPLPVADGVLVSCNRGPIQALLHG